MRHVAAYGTTLAKNIGIDTKYDGWFAKKGTINIISLLFTHFSLLKQRLLISTLKLKIGKLLSHYLPYAHIA
jgi:hypothetical protein